MRITKRIRIFVVLSAIWCAIVVLVAISTAGRYTFGGRGFELDTFFTVLTVGAILPLLVVWGIVWIRSASKG